MKIIKYALALIILIFIGFCCILCNGSYVLEQITTYNRIHIESTVQDMDVQLFDSLARKHNLLFFGRISKTTTLRDEVIDYYCYDDQKEKFLLQTGLQEGTIRQIINFDLHIRFHSLSEMEQNLLLANTVQQWCLLGSDADFEEFCKEAHSLSDYKVQPQDGNLNILILLYFSLLFTSLSILLFFCYMENLRNKKRYAVAVIHGESAAGLFLRQCVPETLIFCAIFFLIQTFVQKSTILVKPFSYTSAYFCAFIIFLWIINTDIIRFNPKEAIGGHRYSQRLIFCMKITDVLLPVLICIAISAIFSIMPSIQENEKAAPFFKANSERQFMRLVTKQNYRDDLKSNDFTVIERHNNEIRNFYNNLDEFFEPICVADCSRDISIGLANEYQAHPLEAIYCNFRAKEYLSHYIPELSNVKLDDYDCVFLIPDTFSNEKKMDAKKWLTEKFYAIEGYAPEKIHTMEYRTENQILCFNYYTSFEFLYFEKPSICLTAKQKQNNSMRNYTLLQSGMLFAPHSQNELDTYFSEYTFEPVCYNAQEKFLIDYRLEKYMFIVSCLLLVFFAIFSIIILVTLLRLDYQVNAIQIAIKKILGYTVLEKNSGYFRRIMGVFFINVIIVWTWMRKNQHYGIWILLIPIGIATVHSCIIVWNIRRIERERICKILKRGAL